jgi:hypothetical protein
MRYGLASSNNGSAATASSRLRRMDILELSRLVIPPLVDAETLTLNSGGFYE